MVKSNEENLEYVHVTFESFAKNNVVRMMVDTGAQLNIIDEFTYKALSPRPELKSKVNRVFAYQQTEPLEFLGKFTCEASINDSKAIIEIAVAKGDVTCILGIQASKNLQIVHFNKSISSVVSTEKSKLESRYPEVFNKKLGKFIGDEVKFDIDESVRPAQVPFRRISFSMREKMEKAIRKMEEDGIIEAVQPGWRTDWISPAMVVPKKSTDEKE